MSAARAIRKKPWSFRYKPSDISEKPPASTIKGVYPFQTRGYTPLMQKGHTLFGQRGLPFGHKGVYPPSDEGVYPFAAKGYTPWVWQLGGLGKSPTGFQKTPRPFCPFPASPVGKRIQYNICVVNTYLERHAIVGTDPTRREANRLNAPSKVYCFMHLSLAFGHFRQKMRF